MDDFFWLWGFDFRFLFDFTFGVGFLDDGFLDLSDKFWQELLKLLFDFGLGNLAD